VIRKILFLSTIIVGILLCFKPVKAQTTGKITGTVIDKQTGESLVGVNVIITGTQNGTASDVDGHYTISNLQPGNYSITATYISFAKKTITGIKVKAGQVVTINITMAPETVGMNAVTVTAAAVKNNEAALLKERQKSIAFSNAISSQQIQQSGSSDVADAMKQVTGASVMDGKYVYIRGLGDRYSNAQLNGSPFPSSDPDRNTVQMDIIPTNLLDNITTIKTFTPDKPGNFTGGNVNIETKSFPDNRVLTVSSSVSYNGNSNYQSGFLTGPTQSMNFWGYPNKSLKIPNSVIGPDGELNIPDIGAAYSDKELANQLDNVSKKFAVPMAPATQKKPVNSNYSFSYGDQYNIAGHPLGVILSGTYSRRFTNYPDGTTGQWELAGKANTVNDLKNNYLLNDTQSKDEIQWGGLANLSYKPSINHKFTFVYLRNHIGQSSARYQLGVLPRDFNNTTHQYENRVLHVTQRDLNSFQLKGKDFFPTIGHLSVNWSGAISDNKQNEPNLRFFTDDFVNVQRNGTDTTIYAISNSIYTLPSQYFRNLSEKAKSAKIDLKFPFQQWSGLSGNLQFGGEYQKTNRNFKEYILQFPNFGFGSNPYSGDPNAFFQPEKMGIIDSTNYTTYGTIAQNATDPAGTYKGDKNISALYGMVELPITQRLRLVTGARYEMTDIKVISADTSKKQGLIKNKDWLPSVNLTYILLDNMNLRASYGRTLARPNFREIAPYASFEFVNGYIFNGNPDLKRTLIDNYDLRLEWFARPGEILSISGFYKYFRNPIEKAFIGINGDIQYQNVNNAKVYGVEFEIRKHLDFLAPFLQHFTLNSNLSLIQSEVRIPDEEFKILQYIYENPSKTRPLQGQSPYVFNAGLTYENDSVGLTAGGYYNVFGKRLANVSLGGTPDIYEMPRNDLSMKITQRIFHKIRISFKGNNLLDSRYREVHEFKGQEYVTRAYGIGRTFSMSVKYTIF